MHQPIAVLDSGVGGLTVAKEIMRQLPLEKILYFGDTARAPYGPRSAEEVRLYTKQIVNYLLQFDPKMIVIACNTATAVALDIIREFSHIPVVGVIHPGARAAIKKTRNQRVGIIGTEGTIRSKAYEKALQQISPHIQVLSKACPLLVPLVEKGLYRSEVILDPIKQSLAPLLGDPLDCLILGCTHYPFLTDAIAEVMGPNVSIINSAEETAREISAILYHSGRLAEGKHLPIHQFFCSGDPEIFRSIAEQWLDEEVHVTPVVWQVTKFK